ncbi:curli assembly protein CsgF [Methylotetracoccus oryzae]|uniref:curli assembly protein CsgF n=1 Tax=Methylotetracoccus oryzae TaxID=1919059 RepID=UPI0013A53ACE|nr:curli assembly protein CsgF [Methylotetracoccus oryzae]
MFTQMLRALAVALLALPVAHGSELVHSFVNPDFGGNPFNYSNLMSGANAINKFKAPTTKTTTSNTTTAAKTSADLFAEQFNALLLNRLANRLVDQAVGTGTGTTTEGTNSVFNTGVNTIMLEGGVGSTATRVTIIDNATGNRTVLDVPNL